MINSYNPNPIIIHAGLLRKKSGYSIFIWGEQKKHKKYVDIEPFKYPFQYSPFELKLDLFRDHSASFYGTFIETTECHIQVPLDNRLFYSLAGNVPVYHVPATYEKHLFPIQGLEISHNDIYQYSSTLLQMNGNSERVLADDFLFTQKLLVALLDELKQGEFIPSQSGGWDLHRFSFQRWHKSAPRSFLALYPTNHSFLEKELEKSSLKDFSIAFITTAITDLLQSDTGIIKAFEMLQQNQSKTVNKLLTGLQEDKPVTQSPELFHHLLEDIGAIEVAPFKLGMRVEDLKGRDAWQLTMFIIDRSDVSLMIDVSELLLGKHPWRDNPVTFFNIALAKAKKQISGLEQLSLTTPSIQVSVEEAYELLTENEIIFQQLGITILVPSWWQKREDNFSVTLQQKELQNTSYSSDPILNWQEIAQFDYSVSVGGVTISEDEFQELVNHKRPIVKVRGKWVFWDSRTAEQIQSKINSFKGNSKLTYMQAYQLQLQNDADNNIQWQTHWNNKVKDLLGQLTDHSWDKIPVPESLNGTLRPYQHDGYSWLLNMRKVGFGACLADDMGLGKTIQTISYLLAIKEAKQGKVTNPFLLICPTSLIGNWEHELQLFAPSLNVYVHHGTDRFNQLQLEKELVNLDIIITSYSLAVRDQELWTNRIWAGLILDEAQHVKNVETKQRRSIKQIEAMHRIALTGTPIENRIKELWSIIDLLNDHFLGSYQQFYRSYIKEIEGEKQNKAKLHELSTIISPFLLRRTKQDKQVHLQLPSKTEIIHRVGLTVEQASLYQAVINDLFDRINIVSDMERRALILSSLTRLKQICNHPAHYLKDGGELEERSEKWDKLMLLVEMIADNGEKALIFSQYRQMGELIKKGLEAKFNTQIPFLHGSLQRHKREELIWQFSNTEAPFFILSLKAGGVGLNLTAATHVIHYDRWWNPAVENQATDRAYRIGQTEDVTVHKLLTKGTLEEKIQLMLEKKQALSDQILNTNENKLSELTTGELEQFLKLRTSSLT